MTKTGHILMLCAALLLLAAAPARADDVPVRVGKQGAYTRIVFDFPKLTAYRVKKVPEGIELTFDTPLGARAPKLPAGFSSFSVTRPDPATLKVVLGAKDPQFKDFRLLRKIVLDVRPGGAEKPAPQEPEPQKNAGTKPAPPPAKEPEKPAIAEAAPAPEAAPVEAVSADPAASTTKITLSTVAPTRLAVFQRFGFLWIVADGQVSSAFAPEVDGPQAGFIGKPKTFRFGKGHAWRYLMPPGHAVQVRRRNLIWDILLTAGAAAPRPAAGAVSVDVDHASRKAKLMTRLPGAGSIITFEDPSAGDTLYLVATDHENARIDEARRFAGLDILPADMGFVLRPLQDGLQVNRLGDYIVVTSEKGITASSDIGSSITATGERGENEADVENLLYDFPNWRQGGPAHLDRNRRDLTRQIVEAQTPAERTALLMRLAWLHFANNLGHETLGILRMIEQENEDMAKTPDFTALKGAASAMAGQYHEALKYLSDPAIQHHPEVSLWIGYAAAATEQWRKASASFPRNTRILVRYPDNIAIPFTLYMAESALRLGRTDTARDLLGAISTASDDFSPQYRAALDYLRGEALRQQGDAENAIRAWRPVAHGIDRLYHTKASLALANLQLQQGKITLKEAIDQIDSLRFAWRGDGLEVQILSNLGSLKVRDGQYLSGLQDMKQAARLSTLLLDDPEPIHGEMRQALIDLFVGGAAQKLPPLEAVSIYNEFGSLLPPGPESAAANLSFADHLIRMDLLEKAENILESSLRAGNLPDAKAAAIGTRLAAIYLLDAKAASALAALDKSARGAMDEKTREERALLRARAQSLLGRTDAAIETLSALSSNDAKKLKVDVLWRARRWAETAAAIESLLPAPKDKISDDEARLIVHMAVASKLSGDPRKLEEIKARYAGAMQDSPLASTFGVVTREGGVATLSDRETILKMAGEVDMFRGFLDSYKKAGAGG